MVLPYLHLKTAVAGRSPKLAKEGKPVAKNYACSARTMSPSDMTLDLRGMTIPWHNDYNRETGKLKGVTIHKGIVSRQELLEEIRRVAGSIPKAER